MFGSLRQTELENKLAIRAKKSVVVGIDTETFGVTSCFLDKCVNNLFPQAHRQLRLRRRFLRLSSIEFATHSHSPPSARASVAPSLSSHALVSTPSLARYSRISSRWAYISARSASISSSLIRSRSFLLGAILRISICILRGAVSSVLRRGSTRHQLGVAVSVRGFRSFFHRGKCQYAARPRSHHGLPHCFPCCRGRIARLRPSFHNSVRNESSAAAGSTIMNSPVACNNKPVPNATSLTIWNSGF